MTSSLLCCLTTTGQPGTQNISPGGHANGDDDLGGVANGDGDLDGVGVGNGDGDDKEDGVKHSHFQFSGNVAVYEDDYDYRTIRRMILITGAGEQEERWRRLRSRRPTATIFNLRLKLILLNSSFYIP